MNYLKYLLEFIILFLICFLYYKLIVFKKAKKVSKKKKGEIPEVVLFINLFKLDKTQLDHKKLGNQLSIIIPFNLALTVVLATEVFDKLILKIAIGFICLLVTMCFSYYLLGLYYKKKGNKQNV